MKHQSLTGLALSVAYGRSLLVVLCIFVSNPGTT
jgi:hypothetical protein